MEKRGLHVLRHTFATTLINGIKQPDGTLKTLPVKQVADLLGHTTSEITEIYYVKRDNPLQPNARGEILSVRWLKNWATVNNEKGYFQNGI